jgi:hypothetical protein
VTETVEHVRVVRDEAPLLGVPTDQRFGFSELAPERKTPEESSAKGPVWSWASPAGWVARPASRFRVADFRLANDERVECYVTVLGGTGGGEWANIDRWRAQMGLGPRAIGESRALPTLPMLGGEATFVELSGAYEGMGGIRVDDALLIGAIRQLPGRTVFVKMTGPAASVEPERERFLAFCASLEELEQP